ncbi:GGDEF domain-containing protein [Thalassotalea sp. PLHSN55]|uniref:GGDEF domain-containing protein n=1 Tax=Thalassotalea sp. PLHSN55 TaxID=3435888 RepID=UPI003F85CF3B
MKYHDSIQEAEKTLALSVQLLRSWNLPASPINYTLSYEYTSNRNKPLNKSIDQYLSTGKELDSFTVEEFYRQHILGQSNFRDEIIDDVEEVLSAVEFNNKHSANTLNYFVDTLDNNIGHFQSHDKKVVATAILSLKKASNKLKQQQLILQKQLKNSQSLTSKLKAELEESRKEIFLDPLTHFYNRKALSKHLEAWTAQDENKQVAAIVVNIDHFSQFTQRFGPLISDVLLAKVAEKVSSYVDDSGLPVRSGGDEFLILLPDLNTDIAQEVAMKISHGVEKLRFVSSKSGIRLPKLDVSVGVGQFSTNQEANNLIKKARKLLEMPSSDNQ